MKGLSRFGKLSLDAASEHPEDYSDLERPISQA